MEVETRLEFNQDIETIYASYTNADFITAKMEALGGRNIEVEVSLLEDNTTTVTIRREMPVEVPKVLEKYAKTWNKTVQTEHWRKELDGTYSAQMTIDVEGVPADIKGRMTLEKTEEGSAGEIVTIVQSSVPFLGTIVSKFICKVTEKTIEQEYLYIQENV